MMSDEKQRAVEEFMALNHGQQLKFLEKTANNNRIFKMVYDYQAGADAVLTCLETLMKRSQDQGYAPHISEHLRCAVADIPSSLPEGQSVIARILSSDPAGLGSIGAALIPNDGDENQQLNESRLSWLMNGLGNYGAGQVMASLNAWLQVDMFPTLDRSIQRHCLQNLGLFPHEHNHFVFDLCDKPEYSSLLCDLLAELPPSDQKTLLARVSPDSEESLATSLITSKPSRQSEVFFILAQLPQADVAHICSADSKMPEALKPFGVTMRVSCSFGLISAPPKKPARSRKAKPPAPSV